MALYNEAGVLLSKSAAQALATTQTAPGATVKVGTPIYEDYDYAGAAGSKQGRRLCYPVGAIVPQAELNARYPTATQTAVAPAGGATAGGTAITVTGTNFTPGCTVTVGGVAATLVTFVSPTSLTATTPAGTAGAKPVVVTTTAGAATGTVNFTYA